MLAFLTEYHQAVMVTLSKDGTPHAVPVVGALVDDRFWISGTHTRVRTKHLQRDPRCTVVVMDPDNVYSWVTITGRAELLTGDPVGDNLRLYELITGRRPDDMDDYADAMVRDRRLVYAVGIDRWYPS